MPNGRIAVVTTMQGRKAMRNSYFPASPKEKISTAESSMIARYMPRERTLPILAPIRFMGIMSAVPPIRAVARNREYCIEETPK